MRDSRTLGESLVRNRQRRRGGGGDWLMVMVRMVGQCCRRRGSRRSRRKRVIPLLLRRRSTTKRRRRLLLLLRLLLRLRISTLARSMSRRRQRGSRGREKRGITTLLLLRRLGDFLLDILRHKAIRPLHRSDCFGHPLPCRSHRRGRRRRLPLHPGLLRAPPHRRRRGGRGVAHHLHAAGHCTGGGAEH